MLLWWSLVLLLCVISAVSAEHREDMGSSSLSAILQRVAGVFKDKPRKGMEKTILMTGCNHGFLNHLENFKCFADRLNMKFLVIALDQKRMTI